MNESLAKCLKFEINPNSKEIKAEIFLKEEDAPLHLTATYDFFEDGIKIFNLKAEKPWINEAIKLAKFDFKSKEIRLKDALKDLLQKFL